MQPRILVPIGVVLLLGIMLLVVNLDLGPGSLRGIIFGLVGVGVGTLALVDLIRERLRKSRQGRGSPGSQ